VTSYSPRAILISAPAWRPYVLSIFHPTHCFFELLSTSALLELVDPLQYSSSPVCAIWLVGSCPFPSALQLSTLFPCASLLREHLLLRRLYCHIPLLTSTFRSSWLSRRWILWLAGMFRLLLENYWIPTKSIPTSTNPLLGHLNSDSRHIR